MAPVTSTCGSLNKRRRCKMAANAGSVTLGANNALTDLSQIKCKKEHAGKNCSRNVWPMAQCQPSVCGLQCNAMAAISNAVVWCFLGLNGRKMTHIKNSHSLSRSTHHAKKINIQANLCCLSISNLPKLSWSITSVLLMLSYFALHIQSQWLRHIKYISIQTAKAWNKMDDKVNNIYINLYNIQYYIIQ